MFVQTTEGTDMEYLHVSNGAGGRMKLLAGFAIAGFLMETAALLVSPAFAALLGVGFCGAVLVYGATSE